MLWKRVECSSRRIENGTIKNNAANKNADARKRGGVSSYGLIYIFFWTYFLYVERTCGLFQVSNLISMQMDRAEYVFLLRLMESLKETASFLDHQERHFNPTVATQTMVFGAVLPQLDVSVVFPPLAASVLQVRSNQTRNVEDAFLIFFITVRIFYLLEHGWGVSVGGYRINIPWHVEHDGLGSSEPRRSQYEILQFPLRVRTFAAGHGTNGEQQQQCGQPGRFFDRQISER